MDEQDRTGTARDGTRWAVAGLVLIVIAIIGIAFRGSWGSFRDATLACHFDRTSANTYGIAVDGLMVVAIISAVLLRHDRGARRYCLWVIAGYTGASLLINYLHGIGMFSPDPVTGVRPVPPWPVVLVIALLLVGSIFLGSHLLVYVWRHMFPEAPTVKAPAKAYQPGTPGDENGTPVPEMPPPPFEAAKTAYRQSLAPHLKTLSQQDLMDRYDLTKRQAVRVQSEVKGELDAEADKAAASDAEDVPAQHTDNGHAPATATEGA